MFKTALSLITLVCMLLWNSPLRADEKPLPHKADYGIEVPYQVGVPILFPELVVTYTGSVLEPGHEKITSEVFEISRGSNTRRIVAPLLSMSGTLVRFGFSFYRLHIRPGHKLLRIEKGIW